MRRNHRASRSRHTSGFSLVQQLPPSPLTSPFENFPSSLRFDLGNSSLEIVPPKLDDKAAPDPRLPYLPMYTYTWTPTYRMSLTLTQTLARRKGEGLVCDLSEGRILIISDHLEALAQVTRGGGCHDLYPAYHIEIMSTDYLPPATRREWLPPCQAGYVGGRHMLVGPPKPHSLRQGLRIRGQSWRWAPRLSEACIRSAGHCS